MANGEYENEMQKLEDAEKPAKAEYNRLRADTTPMTKAETPKGGRATPALQKLSNITMQIFWLKKTKEEADAEKQWRDIGFGAEE